MTTRGARNFLGNEQRAGVWYSHYQDGSRDDHREWWEIPDAQGQALLNFLQVEKVAK